MTPQTETPSVSFLIGILLLFTALTAVMTYPQVLRMREAVNDAGDPLLNTWALSWVAHQLPFAPAHLFDANIFSPERRTLAYSETLLAPGVIVAPLLWAGVGRILVYNLVFVSGFILSGVGTVLLVRDLTRNNGAAIAAGIIFAYLPFRFDHYAHLQLQQAEWIPLALWAFHRVMTAGRLRDGLCLGAFVACQFLSCTYYGVFLASYLVVVGGTIVLSNIPVARARLPVLAASAALGLVLLAPAASAYLGARHLVGERGEKENIAGSATWKNFLATSENNVLYGWSANRFGATERRLFPGIVAIALAAVALWPPWSAVRAAYIIGLLFAVDMTRGFNGVMYRVLYEYAVPFRGLRIPARMGIMVGFSLAVLAGFGVARFSSRLQSRPARVILALAVCIAALVEYRSPPLALQTIPSRPPEIYADLLRDRHNSFPTTIVRMLGDPPAAVIAELPIGRQDPTFMYYSTFHWQTLLNGYSGFVPPSYIRLVAALQTFPDAPSLSELGRDGAHYVVIHGELLEPDEYQSLIRATDALPSALTLVARRQWQGREISLYRLR